MLEKFQRKEAKENAEFAKRPDAAPIGRYLAKKTVGGHGTAGEDTERDRRVAEAEYDRRGSVCSDNMRGPTKRSLGFFGS